MPVPSVERLWDLSVCHQVVGRLLHSANLQKSRTWLATILSNTRFPFQYTYDKQCYRQFSRHRLQEIILHVEPRLHDRIASPTCLQNSRVTLDYSDIIMLGVSPLRAPNKLPTLTDEAYRRVISEAIVFGSMPQTSCEWLLDQAAHRLNFKIPRFWYLIHPECFKESAKRGQNRTDLGKLGLLLHIVFRSNPMTDCIDRKDFTEYLRWIVRICLIGLELNRQGKSDELVDLLWFKEELDGVEADLDATCLSRNEFELEHGHLRVLLLARSLLTAATKWIFFQENSHASRDQGYMPEFSDVWDAVIGKESSLLDEGLTLHWKISLFSLYLQMHPGLVPWIAKRMDEFKVMWNRIWPLDWISLTRLQLDPISYSSLWKCHFLVNTLVAVTQKSESLQNYILKWALLRKGDLTHGAISSQAMSLIKAVPLDRRAQYVRRLWIGGAGPERSLESIQTLHKLCEPQFKSDLLTPSQYITDYFRYLFDNKRVVWNEAGASLVVISYPNRVRLLTTMCALSLIYNIPLPQSFDTDQITTLLDLNSEGVTTISNPTILHAMFPIERMPTPRTRRAALEQDGNLARISAGQRKFHETVPLSRIFDEHELRFLLGLQ